ncbi:asparagine synthase-related protein [Embleya sp. NPDC020630]|uniref:asparagine synthase-related protein n=1 Tax=Embleya sp. NPDC020630 TaxID=3363979 RepID=UPI0037AC1448
MCGIAGRVCLHPDGRPRRPVVEAIPWLLVTGDEATMPLRPDVARTLRIGEYRADTYRTALAVVPHAAHESAEEHRLREPRHLSPTRLLRQLLHRKDRLRMAQGRKVRVPYCDHRVVEYAYDVPWSPHSFDGREWLDLYRPEITI